MLNTLDGTKHDVETCLPGALVNTNNPVDHQGHLAVAALGRVLLTDIAPAEVPLYPAVFRAIESGADASKTKQSGDDDLLGFGPGETVVLLAPVVIQFAQQIWTAVSKEAATATAGGVAAVFRRLRDRFTPGNDPDPEPTPTLNTEQLRYIRQVGRECASHLPLTEEQRRLMVESLVAALAVPTQ